MVMGWKGKKKKKGGGGEKEKKKNTKTMAAERGLETAAWLVVGG